MTIRTMLSVKVVPSSSRDIVAGWLGKAVKIRVSAPPEKGRANKAVEQVLAKALGIERDSIRVVTGHVSPRKVIEITGLTDREVRLRLEHDPSHR